MRVSIITVSFNNAATIEDTIKSVAMQEYDDIEYLVIDGGSTDDTPTIVQKYYPHIIHRYISEPDQGIYDAMNKGINMATGEVIAFLNSDDVYADARVVSTVVAAIKNAEADCAYGDLQYVSPHDLEDVKRYWKSGTYCKKQLLYGWMPPHPTFFAKKSLFVKHGSFDLRFKSAADYELMLRFLYRENAKPVYVNRVLVKMRIGGVSNKSVHNRINANREDRMAWEINNLKPYFFTLWLKPLRKIPQFFGCIQN